MKSPEHTLAKFGAFESRRKILSLLLKQFVIALIMDPSNYFMTTKDRRNLLERYGYTLDANGQLQPLDKKS